MAEGEGTSAEKNEFELEENIDKMFGPLVFEDARQSNPLQLPSEIVCLLCDNVFHLELSFNIFIRHLFEVHSLVIEDIQNIENLPEYLYYWRHRFKTELIEEILPAVKIETSMKIYFLLSTLLKEDKELRHKLQLEYVLKIQEFERTDTNYTRQCIFCKLQFEGTRANFVHHLINQHNLQLGNPQNLVYIEELVNKIDETLNNLNCIFCNRIFPERNVLKEHMRKKLHKRLNRHNKEYDKYFIINYLEPDKNKKFLRNDNDTYILNKDEDSNADEEYYDWNEKEDLIICLFCNQKETNINTLCLHMEADHDFDFSELTEGLDFYQKIKFVNYVRKQMHNKMCLYCHISFKSSEVLQKHLFEEQHCKIPETAVFDQPEFYFPTYENDAFLYLIDDVED